ncbi:MAG: NfeD family protein [Pyrinomonadaceae bacterium]
MFTSSLDTFALSLVFLSLSTSWLILSASGLAALVLAALLLVVALSRHKKGAAGELKLVGRVARVEQDLAPEGAVLLDGEVWRAVGPAGSSPMGRGAAVLIVGASGHMLLVEAVEEG